MYCPKCGSNNVTVQIISEQHLVERKHSVWWWLFFGWYWVPIKWICFFWLALLAKIFAPKKVDIKSTHRRKFVCNNCGNVFE